MKFEYDPEADAAYVQVAEGTIADTREIADGVNIDFDENGNVLGIEILSVKARGPKVRESVTEEHVTG